MREKARLQVFKDRKKILVQGSGYGRVGEGCCAAATSYRDYSSTSAVERAATDRPQNISPKLFPGLDLMWRLASLATYSASPIFWLEREG